MKKIYIGIDDVLVKNAFKKVFEDFSFVVKDKKDADFLFEEVDGKFVLNGDKVFFKPVNVFDVVDSLKNLNIVPFYGMDLYVNKKMLVHGGVEVAFTDIEFKILTMLFENPDGIDVDDMVVGVFVNNTDSNVKTLATHMYNLKKKIEKVSGKQKNIVLENSRYRLAL